MISIYDDIQALKQRFKDEFGADVSFDVSIHGHIGSNDKLNMGKVAVDLICRGGFNAHIAEPDESNGSRWISVKSDDWLDAKVTLFYPRRWQ